MRIPPNRNSAVHGPTCRSCSLKRTGSPTKKSATMNRQPDQRCRDKLQAYQTPVSPEAWKKISQKLHKKNQSVLWLKIAASILLLACAGVVIFSLRTQPTPVVSEKIVPPANQKLE